MFEFKKKANIVIAKRVDKPNIDFESLKLIVESLEVGVLKGQQYKSQRLILSDGHLYKNRARDDLYMVKKEFRIGLDIKYYYLKFFFFDRDEIIGAYFISAREVDRCFSL